MDGAGVGGATTIQARNCPLLLPINPHTLLLCYSARMCTTILLKCAQLFYLLNCAQLFCSNVLLYTNVRNYSAQKCTTVLPFCSKMLLAPTCYSALLCISSWHPTSLVWCNYYTLFCSSLLQFHQSGSKRFLQCNKFLQNYKIWGTITWWKNSGNIERKLFFLRWFLLYWTKLCCFNW